MTEVAGNAIDAEYDMIRKYMTTEELRQIPVSIPDEDSISIPFMTTNVLSHIPKPKDQSVADTLLDILRELTVSLTIKPSYTNQWSIDVAVRRFINEVGDAVSMESFEKLVESIADETIGGCLK